MSSKPTPTGKMRGDTAVSAFDERTSAGAHDLIPEPARHYRRASGLLAGAGVLGWAGLPLMGYPEWDVPALGAGLALGGVSYVSGRKAWQHTVQRNMMASTLAPMIGGPSRHMVTIARDGSERVKLSYVAHQRDYTDEWQQRIAAAVSMRMGESYAVESIDGTRRRIVLAPVRLIPVDPEEEDPRTKEHGRLEDSVLRMIGDTGEPVAAEYDSDGRLTALELRHGDPVRIAQPGVRRNIERLVAAIQPERWRAHWELTQDWVRLERRPVMPTSVWLPSDRPDPGGDLLSNYGRVKIRIAKDEDGRTIEWPPGLLPQMLITGGTGTGKTSTMHALLAEVTSYEWPVWICDGKQIEFLPFRDWPNVQMVATSIQEQVAVIAAAEKVMNHRYTLIKTGQAKVTDFEPLVVVIDELAELVQNLLAWYPEVKGKGGGSKPPTLKSIGSLLRLARTARIHLVVAMQRPDVALLGGGGQGGGEARSNFGFRMSVGRLDPQGAQMMWQNYSTGVAIPRGLRQRGMVTGPDGQPVEAQFFRFPDMDAPEGSEERALIDALRPKRSIHPRMVIEVPAPTLDEETGTEITPVFEDYLAAQWHLANDRPDLDPLIGDPLDPVDGRVAASPASILGVGSQRVPGESAQSEERRAHRHLQAVRAGGAVPSAAEPDLGQSQAQAQDEFAGYDEPADVQNPLDLAPGDLIDLGDGTWGVVEVEPILDPDDETLALVSWRANVGSEEGHEALPADQPITTRKPLEREEGDPDDWGLFDEEG